jgi:hypothetical protein
LIVHALLFLPAVGVAVCRTSSPVISQAVKQLLSGRRGRSRLVDHDDVDTLQFSLVLPERLPHDPLYCVSRCRFPAMFLRDRKPEPRIRSPVGPEKHGEPPIAAAASTFEHAAECRRIE